MENRYHSHNIIGAVILIAIGIIFLLNNLGLVPSDIWSELWRFWPFILILIGVQTMFKNSAKREFVLILVGIIFLSLVILYSLSIENFAVHNWVIQNLPWLQLPNNNPPFRDFNDNLNNLY